MRVRIMLLAAGISKPSADRRHALIYHALIYCFGCCTGHGLPQQQS